MKKILVLGFLIGVLVVNMVSLWPVSTNAATSFTVGPMALYFSFDAGMQKSAMKSFEIIDQGLVVGNYTIGVEKYREFTPEEIAQGLKSADPSWVAAQPQTLMVAPGGKATVNVLVTIPDILGDGQYITYIKVSKGTDTEYVSVSIRTGSAVLEHKYAIDPGFYRLSAKGPGDRETSELLITVRNVGGARGRYLLTVRVPDNLEEGYIEGNPDWVQTIQPNVVLDSGQTGALSFKVVLPQTVADGKYALWIVVKDTDQDSSMQIEYATKLFLDVQYHHGVPWRTIWICVGVAVAIIGMLIGLVIWRKRKREKGPSYKIEQGGRR